MSPATSKPTEVTAAEVDPEELQAFLERSFGARKAAFLRRHGDWWYGDAQNRGRENQRLLLLGGRVAAFWGVMPARCQIGGETREGVWWIDLVVAPEYRKRGLQTLIDQRVRDSGLVLGFPNALAARIHRKHGWGVREDLRALLAPLVPSRLQAIRRAAGARGRLLRAAALAASPLAALWRGWLAARPRGSARRLENPGAEELASLARCAPELTTTVRDAAHFEHRYLAAPYRDELRFYAAGPLLAVVRRSRRDDDVVERVLDLCGDFADRRAFADLTRFILAEAARAGAVQVTALAARPDLVASLARAGFRLRSVARFCWWSNDPGLVDALDRSSHHWCLGDSDNDEPL